MHEYKKQKIFRKALAKWGQQKQIVKAIEEMSELTKALSKDLIGKGESEKIDEEMADVYIMLDQLQNIYYNKSKVEDLVEGKLSLLADRVKSDL